jgi:diguanylate cyclase (GGDEF)-like protein
MQHRRVTYACAGGLLSVGAPLGLCAVRLARRPPPAAGFSLGRAFREIAGDPPDYIYVGTSTAIAFTLFGFMLGRQADRLANLSETDPLTGLSNARGLHVRFDVELSRWRRYLEPLSLLLVDLDGLKTINDRHGHRAGDMAICALADVIRSQLRDTDLGARVGGDEFAILAPATSSAAAMALAERIRSLIPKRSAMSALTGSVGVVTVDPKADEQGVVDPIALMSTADAAMYEAKRRGRNRVFSISTSGCRESVATSVRPGPAAREPRFLDGAVRSSLQRSF